MLLTMTQAQEALGVTDPILRRMIRDGDIAPANTQAPNTVRFARRFRKEDVDKVLADRRALAPPLPMPSTGLATALAGIFKRLEVIDGIDRRLEALERQNAEILRILA